MKLKSTIFVLVLLLLTATVCAAQTPMGFSPDEFYELFTEINSGSDGPEYVYIKGDKEAFILSQEPTGIHMMYSGNQVTDLYYYYNHLDADEEASNVSDSLLSVTLMTFWAINQDDFSMDTLTEDQAYELLGIGFILRLMKDKEPQDLFGYLVEIDRRIEDEYKAGVIRVSKSDSTN